MSPNPLDTAIASAKAAIAAALASPKPSYSIDGQSVSWQQYVDGLHANLERLYKLRQMDDGPFEVRAVGSG